MKGNRPQSVACPAPLRTREDDRIVEIFLHDYKEGQFAHHLDWLPQNKTNVEVIATAKDGTTLALEHTRLFEFPVGRAGGDPDEDPLLGEVTAYLCGIPIPVSDRVFFLGVDPKNLRKLLTNRFRSATLETLGRWARKILPSLHEDREFKILIPVKLPRKDRTVRIFLEVRKELEWNAEESKSPILPCCRYAPYKPDLVPLVRKALQDRLPKLRKSKADRRILMLELITLDRDASVHEAICKLAPEFPDFLLVDEFVYARNLSELCGQTFFRIWDTNLNVMELLVAIVDS
jgi:hypothetical protein